MFINGLKKFFKRGIVRDEKGFTLVEVVVSIALLGIVGAALYTGLSTSSTVLLRNDTWETAKNLAETQMEFVKGQSFVTGTGNNVYDPDLIPPEHSSFTASIEVENLPAGHQRDSYLQKIIVRIFGPAGIEYRLEDYKIR